MTQAFNLSLFANKLNTSGATDNTGLQNSAVTVTAGTGMSGGGSVALGSSVTLTNAGVTSVVAGTGISVSASTGGVTISASGGGTVSSVATGNGLSGGTITTSGTLTVACPTFNTVGSYCYVYVPTTPNQVSGSNYAAGSGSTQVTSGAWVEACGWGDQSTNNLSGTWKWMASTTLPRNKAFGIACRVS
jgi:hypothetical protein